MEFWEYKDHEGWWWLIQMLRAKTLCEDRRRIDSYTKLFIEYIDAYDLPPHSGRSEVKVVLYESDD